MSESPGSQERRKRLQVVRDELIGALYRVHEALIYCNVHERDSVVQLNTARSQVANAHAILQKE